MSTRPQDKWVAIIMLVIFLSASTLCDTVTDAQSHRKQILTEKAYVQSIDTKIRAKAIVNRTEYNREELTLIAKLIEHEARGEAMDGKIAVGNVLINRCFGDKKLLEQEAFRLNAFSGFKKAYPNIKPSKESLQAAKMVLSGHKVVSRGTRYFLNRKTASNHWIERNCKFEKRIGNHSFYSKY